MILPSQNRISREFLCLQTSQSTERESAGSAAYVQHVHDEPPMGAENGAIYRRFVHIVQRGQLPWRPTLDRP